MSVLVDIHVHYYPAPFRRIQFLDAAWRNFEHGADSLGLKGNVGRCLVMTDTQSAPGFEFLGQSSKISSADPWRIGREENDSFDVVHQDHGGKIVIVRGCQIATVEGLEVLTLGNRDAIADGATACEAVDSALEQGALAILPWGFGKWLFARRAALDQVLDQDRTQRPLVADSGLRATLGSRHGTWEVGHRFSMPILAGSDPLPIPGHEARAASFGFVLDANPVPSGVLPWLVKRVRGLEAQPAVFGARSSCWQSLRDQFILRIR